MCTSFTGVFASVSKLTDEITDKLAVVKSRISDTEAYDTFSGDKRTSETGDTYRFTWESTETDVYKRLYVVLNTEDVIINYSESEENISRETKPSVNKMTSLEAAEYAEKLLVKLNPTLEGRIIVQTPDYEDLYSNEYSFDIQRIENGIEVYGDTGYLTISADGSKILHFYINYTCGLDFKTDDGFISKDQAREAYESKLGLKLSYGTEYTSERSKTVRLRYVPSEDYKTYINAKNGEIFTVKDYYEYRTDSSKNMFAAGAVSESAADNAGFSKAEQLELEKLGDLMTVEDAETAVRANGVLKIPVECKLVTSSVTKDYYNDDKYSYYLYFESSDYNSNCSVTCDAKTGEITDYYRYGKTRQEDTITDAQAQKIGEDAVNKLADAYITADDNNTYIIEKAENGSLLFRRYVNGVACEFNTIRITVDKADSSIISYSLTYDELEFPDPSTAISSAEIHDVLFDNSKYNVVYMPSVTEGEIHIVEAVPVYAFSSGSRRFDAFDGKNVNFSDNDDITDYNDIAGHYASEAINTLRRFGIGFAGGKFEPDRIITQGEFLALLETIFDYGRTPIILKAGYDFTNVYNYGIRNNIITADEKNSETPLTRETACVMLIKAMGYDEIASLNGIYVSIFTDVSAENGYIPILTAMGVVNGAGNGKFEPEAELTRADAIIMLYNYLSK